MIQMWMCALRKLNWSSEIYIQLRTSCFLQPRLWRISLQHMGTGRMSLIVSSSRSETWLLAKLLWQFQENQTSGHKLQMNVSFDKNDIKNFPGKWMTEVHKKIAVMKLRLEKMSLNSMQINRNITLLATVWLISSKISVIKLKTHSWRLHFHKIAKIKLYIACNYTSWIYTHQVTNSQISCVLTENKCCL